MLVYYNSISKFGQFVKHHWLKIWKIYITMYTKKYAGGKNPQRKSLCINNLERGYAWNLISQIPATANRSILLFSFYEE